MKKIYMSILAVIMAGVMTSTGLAQSEDQLKTERIYASYMMAIGRMPNSGEVTYWKGRGNLTVAQLVEFHRQYLSGDQNSKRAMIIKAFKNSYGRNPVQSEINTNMAQNLTYYEWMNNHLQWLRKSSTDYVNTLKNAYRAVMRREPNNQEISYWRSQPVMSYMILAAALEQWKATNGNAAKTSGGNTIGGSSSFVDQYKISEKTANETNQLIGAAGGNVIAPGGGNVVPGGGGNVVAAGGMN